MNEILVPSITVLLSLVIMVGLLAWLIKKVGCNCHECGERMDTYEELSSEQQRVIRRYFREEEGRRPDFSAIFVCPHCHFVYDDFSGEKRSMEGDERSYCKVCGRPSVRYMYSAGLRRGRDVFREAYPELADEYECLRCGGDRIGDCVMCDTEPKLFACSRCITLYRWFSPDDTELKFMRPITDETLVEEPTLQVGM